MKSTRGTDAAYVIGAATADENWYDESTAEAVAVRAAGVTVAAGTTVEGLVGLEVRP
jgi:hypothetical protein